MVLIEEVRVTVSGPYQASGRWDRGCRLQFMSAQLLDGCVVSLPLANTTLSVALLLLAIGKFWRLALGF